MAKKKSNSRKFLHLIWLIPISIVLTYYGKYKYEEYKVGKIRYKTFDTYIPKGYAVYGIDVSKYQKTINWERVSTINRLGVSLDFVFVKATEGAFLVDYKYPLNIRSARGAGLAVGSYHFYRANVKSDFQAKHFLRFLNYKKGDLPPVLDIEEENGQSAENIRKGVLNWLKIVEKEIGVKPIIYTNPGFLKNIFDDSILAYPLWVAHYNEKDTPKISNKWQFWQFSEKAKIDGISSPVDMNVFSGSKEEFESFLN
ncbi:MAG: glycoside hydrolase family 25 protein [Leadbetterella sp.]